MHNSSWTLPPALEELAADDEEVIAQLIETFQTDTAARLAHMRAALVNGDLARLRHEAYTIKGSARQIGADALASACHEFELAAIESPVSSLAEQLRRIEDRFDEAGMSMILYSGRPLAAR